VPAGGTVFLGCNDGCLYAVDAQSGRERFRVKTGSRISGAPAVAERPGGGALVVFGSNDGNLYAVDASDGKEVWAFRTGSAGVSSPVLLPQGGLAVFTAQNRTLYGVALDSGNEQFRVPREEALLPPLVPRSSRILALDHQGQTIALDQGTGTEAWRQATGITPAAGPAVSGRMLLVQGRDGRAARFTLPEEG
jgi:eukaryotic-like serine/threonine-protein kinase